MQENTSYNQKKTFVNIILFFVVIIVLGVTLQIESPAIASVLNTYDLLPKPETFTELYFENHLNLPSAVEPGQSYSFSYTVHNEEYKNMKYPYAIFIQQGNKVYPVEKGNFTLPQDGKKTIKVAFQPPVISGRSEVVVNLVNLNQQIDFWITE